MHGCPVRRIGKRLPIYYIKRFRGQNKPEIFGYMRFFTKNRLSLSFDRLFLIRFTLKG